MASSALMLVGCPLPPTAGANYHMPATINNALSPLQIRRKKEQEQEVPKPFSTASRRAWVLHLAAASLIGITLFSTRPVEARIGRLENKRKAREKLEMLREKAGVSKNKEDTLPSQPLGKEEKL
ncbi:hypothetical protein U1Q18_029641 [Sarracenia purpurea var. burkii]